MKVVASRRGLGFTLIELLAVIAIIAIVAALLFPVFSSVKSRAFEATELSNLRQLTLAHNLYVADHDDVTPGASYPLIVSRRIPSSLVASPLDPFKIGWANEIRLSSKSNTSYKDSFVALADVTGHPFFEEFRASSNGGWLLSASPHLPRFGLSVSLHRITYRRLTFEGGVQKRIFPVEKNGDGATLNWTKCFSDDFVLDRFMRGRP